MKKTSSKRSRNSPLERVLGRAIRDRAFFTALVEDPAATVTQARIQMTTQELGSLKRALAGTPVDVRVPIVDLIRRLHQTQHNPLLAKGRWRGHWRKD